MQNRTEARTTSGTARIRPRAGARAAGALAAGALAALALALSPGAARAQETEVQHLSGTDKDHTVGWEFFVTAGRRSGQWTTIPVPSCWELQGFGTYNYGHDGTPRAFNKNPRADEKGMYRHKFLVPLAWKGKRVNLVFDGSMTDTEARLNGQPAGPIHQGAFYRFKYDVGALVKYGGENQLEVTVGKVSANESVNRAERFADYWIFGGIFRPVYLEALPAAHVERVAIDARHDGAFLMDVYLGGVAQAGRVQARIRTTAGKNVGAAMTADVEPGANKVTLRGQFGRAQAQAWSPEFPNLHKVEVTLIHGGRVSHRMRETFGFRTIEVREQDGIYVNGTKVRMRGVDRHSFWPDSGRTTSPAVSEGDIQLMKDMNMNAVRMSHYPPDAHFLDAADRLGLYVLDEIAGWAKKYDTQVGEKIVYETVVRDVNHPSVIFWDNGNEGGFNFDLDDDFALWDPQKRPVLHPWASFGGIETAHYEPLQCCAGMFFEGKQPVMPTEELHGLYDGGHGAGLDDWWNKMVAHPLGAGGFLWALVDEGVVRTDRNGAIDTDGNHGADGIVGPYREKEGSFFTIKEVWSPVFLPWATEDRLPPAFDGRLRVENRFDFTNLKQVALSWRLVDFAHPGEARAGHAVAKQGTVVTPDVAPHHVGTLALALPPDWKKHDALLLSAKDPHGRHIWTWSWMIATPAEIAVRITGEKGGAADSTAMAKPSPAARGAPIAPGTTSDGKRLVLRAGDAEVEIDAATGLIAGARHAGKNIALGAGPRVVGQKAPLQIEKLSHKVDTGEAVAEVAYGGKGGLRKLRWRLAGTGWLRCDYEYLAEKGAHEYLGVTFDFPETDVTRMTWLGRGPYRVWKNRLRGNGFDVWQKNYNDTVTGVTWKYPEFKGFHGDLYWARLDTKDGPLDIATGSDDIFFRVLTPRFTPDSTFAQVRFPEGNLSFLNGIAPIGTKFHPPTAHGPQGLPNEAERHGIPYRGTLYFRFGGTAAGGKAGAGR